MSRRAWLAFAAVSLIWGVPYLFIRIAVRHGVPPLGLAWARVTLAAVVLLALAWRAGTLRTLRGRWPWLAAYAVAEIAIPFPLIGVGEQRVSSSLAAIVIAAVPLIGAVLAMRFDPSERPTRVRAVGLLVGFGGVIALVGIDVAGSSSALLCTAAAFVIFSVLVAEAGSSRATVITYVNPVVAVALGVTLLGERPGAGAVAGLLLILAGSWLSTDGGLPPGLRRPGKQAAVPAAASTRS
jgi:drug/metabolite transporter (DMT)-like permease